MSKAYHSTEDAIRRCADYRAGKSVKSISNEYGIPRSTVYYRINKYKFSLCDLKIFAKIMSNIANCETPLFMGKKEGSTCKCPIRLSTKLNPIQILKNSCDKKDVFRKIRTHLSYFIF